MEETNTTWPRPRWAIAGVSRRGSRSGAGRVNAASRSSAAAGSSSDGAAGGGPVRAATWAGAVGPWAGRGLAARARARGGLLGHRHVRPGADDVPHGEQPADVLTVDDDQVAESAPDHRGRGLLERPVGRREDQVAGAVVGDEFGVRVLAGAQGVEDVAFREDADTGVLGIDHDGGTDSPR